MLDSVTTTTTTTTPAPAAATKSQNNRPLDIHKGQARTTAPTGPRTPAPSRIAVWAAHVAVLSTVPSGLWRIAGAAGIPLGFGKDDLLHESNFPSRYSFYLLGLSILAELVALLTLGLVRRWGEVVPRWIPFLGGRTVNRWAATIPALLGAAVLCTVGLMGILTWNSAENMGAPDSPSGTAYWVMTLAYAPLLLWGPALTVTAIAYFRRRAPHTPN